MKKLLRVISVGYSMTYGQRLQQAMTVREMDRKTLAKALDCTVQTIGIVITGGGRDDRVLSTPHHNKAVERLSINGDWLATGKGEMLAKPAPEGQMITNAAPSSPTSPSSLDEFLLLSRWLDLIQDPIIRTAALQKCMQVVLEATVQSKRQQALDTSLSQTDEKRHA
jgi:hypothetical protein